MDDLHVVSIFPINPLTVDEQKAHKGPFSHSHCSVKSLTTRSFSTSHFLHQSCKGGFTNNVNKWRFRVNSSPQNPFNKDPALADGSAKVCKVEKTVERNPRKKGRKRGKRKKNLLGCNGSTEHGCTDGSLLSTNDIGHGVNMVEALEASFLSSPIESHASTCYDSLQSFNERNQNMHRESISSLDYPCYAKNNSSLVLDSVSHGLKSEENCPENYSKLRDEKHDDTYIAELPRHIVREHISPEDIIGTAEPCDDAESLNFFRKRTDGERNLHTLGMKGKHSRKLPKNCNLFQRSSLRNLNKNSGKENSNSVWQKVRRNEDECNSKFRRVNSVCSETSGRTKDSLLYKNAFSVAEPHSLSKFEDKSRAKLKVPETNMQQNEFLDSSQARKKKGNVVSNAHSRVWCPRVEHHPDKVESGTFEPIHSTEMSSSNVEAGDRASIGISDLRDQSAENQVSLLFNSYYPLGPSELHEELSALSLHIHVYDKNGKKEQEVPVAVSSRQDKDSFLQKKMSCNSLSIGECHKLAGKIWTTEVIKEEVSASDSYPLVSTENFRGAYDGQSSESINNLPSRDESQVQKVMDKSTCLPKERYNNHSSATCLTPEISDQISFDSENDSNDIVSAVNGSHWAQLASEALEMASGCPIAEFERFLHSASPVLCLSHDVLSCQACLPGQVAGASLRKDTTLNISLGSLWQWYEKPGSYGLEVIAEDCEDSKRLGRVHSEFRAYFVPFLSAVQLFSRCKSCPAGKSDMMTEIVTGEPQEMDESVIIPMFPVLVPQPHTENKTVLPPQNHVSDSDPSSMCIKEKIPNVPVGLKLSDDMDLLFEYFECEQPQQRRPLFEMIKELVRGEGASKCLAHGDPTVLDRVGLQDLHQSSWYSVAWYPIYRIPDGTFRAAFLTYHSLGNFVHREPICDMSMDVCLASPVVGLQSYNAQGECWFRPRLPAHCRAEKILTADTHGILQERLRTLEQTASLMARAVVMKGCQAVQNRQPDYEFFLSRRHL